MTETLGQPAGTLPDRPEVLYIGAFAFPDQNAAAHRVIANAKLLRQLGYRVILVSTLAANHVEHRQGPDCVHGFECWTVGGSERFSQGLAASALIARAIECRQLAAIILYNLPVVPSLRLIRYARKRRSVKVIGDIAEWYTAEGPLWRRIVKALDIITRMRIVNRKLDGLVVISKFLEQVYSGGRPLLLLPPLVDVLDRKWRRTHTERLDFDRLRLTYAGSPSNTKERLDLAVSAVCSAAEEIDVRMDIVGITRSEYHVMYPRARRVGDEDPIIFHGRVSHTSALQVVKESDATLLVRDDSRLTRAGFPTKFVESISCGTPVIATNSSDLADYLTDNANGVLAEQCNLTASIIEFAHRRPDAQDACVERNRFDYRKFENAMARFLEGVGV